MKLLFSFYSFRKYHLYLDFNLFFPFPYRCLEQQNPVTLMASSNILAGNSNQQNPDENLPNSAPPLPLPVTYGPPAYDPVFDYQQEGYNAY